LRLGLEGTLVVTQTEVPEQMDNLGDFYAMGLHDD